MKGLRKVHDVCCFIDGEEVKTAPTEAYVDYSSLNEKDHTSYGMEEKGDLTPIEDGWYYIEADQKYRKFEGGVPGLMVAEEAWPIFKSTFKVSDKDFKGTIVDD